MNRTCIVLAPPVYQGPSIADGFRRLGWEAHLVTFAAKPRYSMANPINWLRKPEPGRDVTRRFDHVLREQVLPLAERCDAALILVYHPDAFGPETEQALSSNRRPIATWVIDSLCRVPDQGSLEAYSAADFFLDGGDARGPKAHWLPLGVDEELVARCAAEKETDVLFIGNLERPYYGARHDRFHELRRSSVPPRFRCEAVVTTGGRVGDELLRRRAPFPVSRTVGIEAFLRRIAGAKVCINIMPSDGTTPINDGFMLVPAMGTCQLADRREFLSRWLTPGTHFEWFEEGRMLPCLEELLADPDRVRAAAEEGRREVLAQHTYRHRVQTILGHLGLER